VIRNNARTLARKKKATAFAIAFCFGCRHHMAPRFAPYLKLVPILVRNPFALEVRVIGSLAAFNLNSIPNI
jgi:hypothetical protein